MEKDSNSSIKLQNAIITNDINQVISLIAYNDDEKTNDQLWAYIHFSFSRTSQEDETRFRDAVQNKTINPSTTTYWDYLNKQNKKLFMAAVQDRRFNPASQAFWDFLNDQLKSKNIANILICTAFLQKPYELQKCIDGYNDPEMNGIDTTPRPANNEPSFKIDEKIKKWIDKLFTFWCYKNQRKPLNNPLFIDFFKSESPRKLSSTNPGEANTVHSFDFIQIPFHEFLKTPTGVDNEFVQLVLQTDLNKSIVHYIGDRIISSYNSLFNGDDSPSFLLMIQFIEILKNEEDSHPLKSYLYKESKEIFAIDNTEEYKPFTCNVIPNPWDNKDASIAAKFGCNWYGCYDRNEDLQDNYGSSTPHTNVYDDEVEMFTPEQLRMLFIVILALSSLLLLLPTPYYLLSLLFMAPTVVLLFYNEKEIQPYHNMGYSPYTP